MSRIVLGWATGGAQWTIRRESNVAGFASHSLAATAVVSPGAHPSARADDLEDLTGAVCRSSASVVP
jgi:hypothetical protein